MDKNIGETTIDIDAKSDSFDPTQQNNEEKIDQPHNGEEIEHLLYLLLA